jgi:hypothetical protein
MPRSDQGIVRRPRDERSEAPVTHPCGRGGRASPVSGPRSFPPESCVRRRPCRAWLTEQTVQFRCTLGSDWQSRACPASVRTLPRRRSKPAQEIASSHGTTNHDLTKTQFSLMCGNRMQADGRSVRDAVGAPLAGSLPPSRNSRHCGRDYRSVKSIYRAFGSCRGFIS